MNTQTGELFSDEQLVKLFEQDPERAKQFIPVPDNLTAEANNLLNGAGHAKVDLKGDTDLAKYARQVEAEKKARAKQENKAMAEKQKQLEKWLAENGPKAVHMALENINRAYYVLDLCRNNKDLRPSRPKINAALSEMSQTFKSLADVYTKHAPKTDATNAMQAMAASAAITADSKYKE